MWTKFAEPETPQMTIWRMSLTCWTTKVTDTHSEYFIFLLLRDKNCYANAPFLRYMYICSPVAVCR